jgi:hypothetical protein
MSPGEHPSDAQPSPVFAQSGSFVTSGGGMPGSEDGVITVLLGILVGALGGLMGGFIISHLCRYVGYLLGRQIGGGRWVLICGLIGAAVLGIKAWMDGRE